MSSRVRGRIQSESRLCNLLGVILIGLLHRSASASSEWWSESNELPYTYSVLVLSRACCIVSAHNYQFSSLFLSNSLALAKCFLCYFCSYSYDYWMSSSTHFGVFLFVFQYKNLNLPRGSEQVSWGEMENKEMQMRKDPKDRHQICTFKLHFISSAKVMIRTFFCLTVSQI